MSVFIMVVESEGSTDFRIKEIGKGTSINDNSTFWCPNRSGKLAFNFLTVPSSFKLLTALFTVEFLFKLFRVDCYEAGCSEFVSKKPGTRVSPMMVSTIALMSR